MAMSLPPSEPTYTVFIRLPFARRGFIDPPPVDWDSSKDDALWAIVSSLAKTDIDWNDIAAQFHVTVDFLLQHVAWLTDRHASQVRAQMRRAQHTAPTPTPTPTPASANQQSQQPQDVTPTTTTTTTTTSTRATPRPPSTRTSSTNTTVFTARNLGASTSTKPNSHSHSHSRRRRLSSLPITTHVDDRDADRDQHEDSTSPNPAESSSAASSSSTDDDDESSPAQSRIIRRPPQNHDDDDDDDDTRPAFLPYRQTAEGTTSGQHDLSATLRGNPRATGKKLSKPSGRDRIHHSQTSDSSTGSTPLPSRAPDQRPSGPLSPRRTMELSGRSSGAKGKGYSRDSDDTPSMGSSFSDLDDASVTQSALEEALASNMQDGGTIASLRGTIGNAFRSRYQTKGQQR